MDFVTFFGLIFLTAGSTLLGSLPVLFHRYFKEASWNWWESFGGGVMISASVFSLFIPAYEMKQFDSMVYGILSGIAFIFLMMAGVKFITQNIRHQRAFLFVFAMGLHNIPEGLAVGVDVAARGWRDSLPLTVAIFIQNLPEGLASAMSFMIAGLGVKRALVASGVTAMIEAVSALGGFVFVTSALVSLPFLLSFAGACMVSVVVLQVWQKYQSAEAATLSPSGFGVGVLLCAGLDILL